MTTHTQPDEVLVLRPSRLGSLLIALGCAVAVRGLWAIRNEADRLTVWLALAFFGFGALLGTIRLIPGASYLRLDPQGFTFCAMFRRQTTAWTDASEFGVSERDAVRAYSTVGFNFMPGYGKNLEGRELTKKVMGWEGTIPGKYGLRATELAELMNEWRQRYGNR